MGRRHGALDRDNHTSDTCPSQVSCIQGASIAGAEGRVMSDTQQTVPAPTGESRKKRRKKRNKQGRNRAGNPPTASPPQPTDRFTEADSDPHRLAREYVRQRRTDPRGRRTIRHWRGDFWIYGDGRYVAVPPREFEGQLNSAIRREFQRIGAVDRWGNLLKVTPHVVRSVAAALQGMVQVPGDRDQPFGIGPLESARGLLPMANGLLDIESAVSALAQNPLQEHSPNWFSPVKLPYSTCRGRSVRSSRCSSGGCSRTTLNSSRSCRSGSATV